MTLVRIRRFVADKFLSGQDPDSIDPDTPLVSSGVIDSVGTLKVVLFLEETFGIQVSTEDILEGRIDTISRMEQLVSDRTGQRT